MSLAIWDVPSPVLIGQRFTIKVGAKPSGASASKDARIEVRDEAGALMACGALGDAAWPETSALYWTEIDLVAPMSERVASWSVRFASRAQGVPDGEAVGAFGFVVVRPPRHKVRVKVVDKENGAPIGDGHVRMGVYRATTDESGLAEIDVPPGTFDVIVWKARYLPPSQTIDVTGDVSMQLELEALPDEQLSRWL